MSKEYWLYILTNPNKTVLYVGMTNDLNRRVAEHRSKLVTGFSNRYNLVKLIYAESFPDPMAAITAEKKVKKWPRWRKVKLIGDKNPCWDDLTEEVPAVHTAG